MDLKEKLITTPKREDAGGRTANRFAYQFYWALYKLLQLFESQVDFVLIMEFIEDVIVLDSSSNPQLIDFYQIKTNAKENVQYISISNLTTQKKKNTMSFIEKLMDNLNRYPKETRSLHFVSNKFFNIGMKTESNSSKNLWSITLPEIGDSELTKLKAHICRSCCFSPDCSNDCHTIVHLDVSELDVITYHDVMLGKFVDFINDMFGNGSIVSTKAMFNTILSEIMRINNTEKKAANFADLVKSKSITRSKFSGFLEDFKRSFLMDDNWTEISCALRSPEEGYNNMEILKIKKQWDLYKLDSLNSDSPTLNKIKEDIRYHISNKEFVSFRECIEYVHARIYQESYHNSGLFSDYYITAMILGEMYNA